MGEKSGSWVSTTAYQTSAIREDTRSSTDTGEGFAGDVMDRPVSKRR